jgi:uncharacterized protein YbbK (DUF523 family)
MLVPKILISACLLGQKVRYDGHDCLQTHERLHSWIKAGNVVTICPEIAGGLSTPRPPAEIQDNKTGIEVLNGEAKIAANDGNDVTSQYIDGARKTLALAQEHNINVAILKARSPSCGSKYIYDGTFSRTIIPGMGTTAALLSQHGILVFDEDNIDDALDAAESYTRSGKIHIE